MLEPIIMVQLQFAVANGHTDIQLFSSYGIAVVFTDGTMAL
jgi:hypothetical protein